MQSVCAYMHVLTHAYTYIRTCMHACMHMYMYVLCTAHTTNMHLHYIPLCSCIDGPAAELMLVERDETLARLKNSPAIHPWLLRGIAVTWTMRTRGPG